jgi:hypothetical protein
LAEINMTSSSSAHLDQLILSVAKSKWQKVAMVIIKAHKIAERTDFKTSDGALASRISAMCTDGRLELQGNLSRWRHSEVRLPAKVDDDYPKSNT